MYQKVEVCTGSLTVIPEATYVTGVPKDASISLELVWLQPNLACINPLL